jgi:hypothetical protein
MRFDSSELSIERKGQERSLRTTAGSRLLTFEIGWQPRRAFNRGLTDDSKGIGYPSIGLTRHDVTAAHYEWIPATHVVTLIDGLIHDEPTWRCHQNPFIGALGTQRLAIYNHMLFPSIGDVVWNRSIVNYSLSTLSFSFSLPRLLASETMEEIIPSGHS